MKRVVMLLVLVLGVAMAGDKPGSTLNWVGVMYGPPWTSDYEAHAQVTTLIPGGPVQVNEYWFADADKHVAVNKLTGWLKSELGFPWPEMDPVMEDVWDPDLQAYTVWTRQGVTYWQEGTYSARKGDKR